MLGELQGPLFTMAQKLFSFYTIDRISSCWPSRLLTPYCQGHTWQHWTENVGIFISSFWLDSLQHSILGHISLAYLENLNWQDVEIWIFPAFLSKTFRIVRNVSHEAGLPFLFPMVLSPFYFVKSTMLQMSPNWILTNPVSESHLSFWKRNKVLCRS